MPDSFAFLCGHHEVVALAQGNQQSWHLQSMVQLGQKVQRNKKRAKRATNAGGASKICHITTSFSATIKPILMPRCYG
jgi:23S rRNA maturation mini-RNase III